MNRIFLLLFISVASALLLFSCYSGRNSLDKSVCASRLLEIVEDSLDEDFLVTRVVIQYEFVSGEDSEIKELEISDLDVVQEIDDIYKGIKWSSRANVFGAGDFVRVFAYREQGDVCWSFNWYAGPVELHSSVFGRKLSGWDEELAEILYGQISTKSPDIISNFKKTYGGNINSFYDFLVKREVIQGRYREK